MNRRILPGLLVVLAMAGLGLGWIVMRKAGSVGPASAERDARPIRYHCPMHPTIVMDHSGDCPICSMRLVPLDREQPEPGAQPTCEPQPPAASAVAGRVAVRISLQKQQIIGVRTSIVARAPFRRSLRAVSQVTLDETRLHHLHTKVSGYVERLFANTTGESVREGAPLLEIYSPELLASQQEYLVALEARRRTAGSSLESVAASGEQLVTSARRRLALFDMAEEQIVELEQTGRARRTVTVFAPMAGTVLQRNVTHGERVGPEMTLLDLADLSRVWAIASVYEYELPYVHDGQAATLTLSYAPGRTFAGRVSFVYPTLDPQTRTAQVRIELANPTLELKPGMYGEALIEADLGPRLALPATAVIETGTRSLVFVDRGEGWLEPREIRLGLRLPELYEVLSGLAEGERVLTSGNFLVDSESRLEAALAAATPPAAHEH